MKKYRLFLTIFIIYIIINMVISPKLYIDATLSGISAWAFNVLPSVLPFIFFTKVLSNLGVIEKFSNCFARPLSKVFHTPAISGYVFLMSIISGYPVGAKMTADLYQSGKISRSDAFRMNSFCSTSGPMFIIGAVGTMMLANPKFGYIIFIGHVLGAFLNGFIYRNCKATELPHSDSKTQSKSDLSSMIVDSALSIISVGTIIAVFFVIITSLNPLLSLFPEQVSGVFSGLIEITRGCLDLSSSFAGKWSIVAISGIISFGGISTLLQSLTMLESIKIPVWLVVLQKLTHALLAMVITACLVLIF